MARRNRLLSAQRIPAGQHVPAQQAQIAFRYLLHAGFTSSRLKRGVNGQYPDG
jgi:hypothetical protein